MRFGDILTVAAQRGGGTITLDTDASAYFAAVVAAGGTVSATEQSLVNTFIVQEKASGNWALTDDYWRLWGESAIQSLVSIKQLRTATVTAAPTFTAGRDYTFDGATNFINTGFVPSTHCVAASGTNQRLAVYERTASAAGTKYDIGAFTSATVNFRLNARAGAGAAAATFNSGVGSATLPSDTALGYIAASRASGGTSANFYKNGAAMTPATGLTVGTTLTANALYIGAFNNAGTAAGFRPCSIGFACVGAPLSAAQELAQYTAVQNWATAVGANV